MTNEPVSTKNQTQARDAGPTPVSVLGLGLMGQALAQAFLRAGHTTTVWNRTASKAEQLLARGAKIADSPEAAIASSPLVVVCVSDYHAARSILEPLGESLEGRVLVNLTSGTSQEARELAEWAVKQAVNYFDGAIMASPAAIGTADAVLLYSGPRQAFDRYESALASLGAGTTYLGEDHGLSSLYDVAVLALMWSILNGFLQGASLLATAGIDAGTFAPFASSGIETVTGWLPGMAQQVDTGNYADDDSTIATHLAAMKHLVHESEFLGVNADLPRFVKALADRAVAAGQGGLGYAALIEQFRQATR